MKFSNLIRVVVLLFSAVFSAAVLSATMLVNTQQEFNKAVRNLQPGDTLQLANGVWSDFEIVLAGQGTADNPITLTAEDKGQVIISGQSNLRLAGEYLVVSGLVFRNGYSPTSEVISFRHNAETLAFNSRVTEVVIEGFNNPERTETDSWVMLYGRNNRFDHNHLVGKRNNGVTVAVQLNSPENQQNRHLIDHNYFGPRPVLGSNGGESLRIGTSEFSLTDSLTVVENNYFERCDGEVEIISSKSGGNVFRGNVFFESRGTLTLRHGNGTLVENNVFIGNGVNHTGGIRVINKRQTVRNNYLQGLTGYRFGSALVIMNGVPDSPINRYHQVEDSLIENNSIIDSSHIEFAAGSDEERSAVPLSTRFRNNLVFNADGQNIITVYDDISGIKFEGNVVNQVKVAPIAHGFSSQDVELQESAHGLKVPKSASLQSVGIDPGLKVLSRDATGVSWYPKPDRPKLFDSGAVIPVSPGESKLESAAKSANAGDVIELADGEYLVREFITLDKPLTIRAADSKAKPRIQFERSALFQINNGGSLKLEGLSISGASAPDNAGNTLIRTSRYSMLNAYQLLVHDCDFEKLNVNHSFNFMMVAKGTFADRIEITSSTFSDVSGAILELDQETDDLGLYNAEYITIKDSTFERVGEAVAVIYRGGTDESTFGPHFSFSGNLMRETSVSNRNKSGASVALHGVQVASLDNNQWVASAPVRVMLTVGDPVTTISNNRFETTAEPEVLNGQASLIGNSSSK
jgi:poly(beta-D-mannuronate) lyase